MQSFLTWLEQQDTVDLVLKAGLAHLRFVTLHPFDDGNGRIRVRYAIYCMRCLSPPLNSKTYESRHLPQFH